MKKKHLFFTFLLFFCTTIVLPQSFYKKDKSTLSPLNFISYGLAIPATAGIYYYGFKFAQYGGRLGFQGLRLGAGLGLQASGALLSAMRSNPRTTVAVTALLIGAYGLKRMMNQKQTQQTSKKLTHSGRTRTPQSSQQRQKRSGQTQRN